MQNSQGFFGISFFIEIQLPELRLTLCKGFKSLFFFSLNEDGALFWVMTSDPPL